MNQNPLQEALKQVKMVFENGWNLERMRSEKPDGTTVLVQLPVSDIIAAAVAAAFTTCQAIIEKSDKLTQNQLLNRTEAAIYLGCSRQTLINYETTGVVMPIRLNGQPFYRQFDLDNLGALRNVTFKNEGDASVLKPKVKKRGRKRKDPLAYD